MNYPGGVTKRKSSTVNTNYANRGMTLEEDLNITNSYYSENNIAFIYKKPTPIKILKVDYPSRQKAVVKEAVFIEPSTTDYNGLYKGFYIDFEAKETKSKTAFPLNNIHNHQLKHINNILKHNGIAFVIIRFTVLDQTFLLKGEDLIDFIENETRKSIPIDYFLEKAHLIPFGLMPRLDYLKVINNIYGGIIDEKKRKE